MTESVKDEDVPSLVDSVLEAVVEGGGADDVWAAWARSWLSGNVKARSPEATLAALRIVEAVARFRTAMTSADPARDLPALTARAWGLSEARVKVTQAAVCLCRGLTAGARESILPVALGKVPGLPPFGASGA